MQSQQHANGERGWLSGLATITDMFAYPLKTSHYVELVNPLWTTHKMQAQVVDVWDETKDSRTITLKAGANWRMHSAGESSPGGVRPPPGAGSAT